MKLARLLIALCVCFQTEACEILVKATDFVHPDPVEDRMGAWKQGYPVIVGENGTDWGDGGRLPDFWLIKIPDLTVAKALQFIAPWEESGTNYSRRIWGIVLTNLPSAIQAKLQTNGVITIPGDMTWNQARQAIKNRKTGAIAPANP